MLSLQDAKNHFSAVVEAALSGRPQHVSHRGKPAVVVTSAAQTKARGPRRCLAEGPARRCASPQRHHHRPDRPRHSPPRAPKPQVSADLSVCLAHTTGVYAEWKRFPADLGHAGADLMIPAQALARGRTVVTGKVSNFTPTGVAVEVPLPDTAGVAGKQVG